MIETPNDDDRCAVCGGPLLSYAYGQSEGCVRGSCMHRPVPRQLFDADRARREYAVAGQPDVWPEGHYPGRARLAAQRVREAASQLEAALSDAERLGLTVDVETTRPSGLYYGRPLPRRVSVTIERVERL